jgi:rhamnogalacturonyl hydrolase YesR
VALEQIEDSLRKLQRYIERENYKGYDPYDTLNSVIPFRSFGKWTPIIATQIQKRNPFNIRGLIGIKKDYNPKGIGLFLHGYSILAKRKSSDKFEKQTKKLITILKNKITKGYHGSCWGYNFGWSSPEKYLAPFSPTSVATGFVAKGLFAYYQVTKDEKIKELLLSIGNFVCEDLERVESADGAFISYSTKKLDCCYNASLLAGEILAILHVLSPNEKYKRLAIETVKFVVKQQHTDGHWGYSLNLKTGKERIQTDFHQGFILESIYNIVTLLGYDDTDTDYAMRKGLDYYVKHQFNNNGRSYWRIPAKYPTDIHHQAQGIITICRMKKFAPQYLPFAEQIATWTIENMQNKKSGAFIYKKGIIFNNPIKFMRWGQAWMFVALSELISIKEK